jgi:hypothetical protein
MDITIARVLIGLLGLAIVLGGLLLVLSFVVPKLRFARGKTVADMDNETGLGGPRPL